MPTATVNVMTNNSTFSGTPSIKYRLSNPSQVNGGPGMTGKKLPIKPPISRAMPSSIIRLVNIK